MTTPTIQYSKNTIVAHTLLGYTNKVARSLPINQVFIKESKLFKLKNKKSDLKRYESIQSESVTRTKSAGCYSVEKKDSFKLKKIDDRSGIRIK